MAGEREGHGFLIFATLCLITGAGVGVYFFRDSEVVQRVRGNREDHRLEGTALTPRFEYAAAKLQISTGSFLNDNGTLVDLTTTEHVAIDHQTKRAADEIAVARTAVGAAPGAEAAPADAFSTHTEILTPTDRYVSPADPSQPWTSAPIAAKYYGTQLDDDYIPMIDDILGFELRDLTASTATRPLPNASEATTTYTYQLDLGTYRRAVAILSERTKIDGPDSTPLTLTLGFDGTGLLRYADVGVERGVASTIALARGPQQTSAYHYTMTVDTISGEPISIDVPTNVVSAG